IMTVLIFSMCSSPKVEYADYEGFMNRHIDTLLKSYNASDNKYSLLTFTSGFKDHSVIITNKKDTIYNGNLISDESMGLSKSFRIDNRFDTKIIEIDSDYSFVIKSKLSKSHKFIYIRRNPDSKKYTITYSNTLRPFR